MMKIFFYLLSEKIVKKINKLILLVFLLEKKPNSKLICNIRENWQKRDTAVEQSDRFRR